MITAGEEADEIEDLEEEFEEENEPVDKKRSRRDTDRGVKRGPGRIKRFFRSVFSHLIFAGVVVGGVFAYIYHATILRDVGDSVCADNMLGGFMSKNGGARKVAGETPRQPVPIDVSKLRLLPAGITPTTMPGETGGSSVSGNTRGTGVSGGSPEAVKPKAKAADKPAPTILVPASKPAVIAKPAAPTKTTPPIKVATNQPTTASGNNSSPTPAPAPTTSGSTTSGTPATKKLTSKAPATAPMPTAPTPTPTVTPAAPETATPQVSASRMRAARKREARLRVTRNQDRLARTPQMRQPQVRQPQVRSPGTRPPAARRDQFAALRRPQQPRANVPAFTRQRPVQNPAQRQASTQPQPPRLPRASTPPRMAPNAQPSRQMGINRPGMPVARKFIRPPQNTASVRRPMQQPRMGSTAPNRPNRRAANQWRQRQPQAGSRQQPAFGNQQTGRQQPRVQHPSRQQPQRRTTQPPAIPLASALRQVRRSYASGRVGTTQEYHRLIQLYPLEPTLPGELGNIYYQQGKLTQAAEQYYETAMRFMRRNQPGRAACLLRVLQRIDPVRANALSRQTSQPCATPRG